MNQDLSLKTRIDQAYDVAIGVTNAGQRLSLVKMHHTCQSLWAEMDKEFVVCRRVWKITPKYRDLQTKLEECLAQLEQYLVLAKLMG